MSGKNGQNEGTIYQRKDGRWVAAVTIQGKLLSKYFKNKKDAKEWLKQTIAQIDAGLSYQGTQYTLDEYMGVWLKSIGSSVRPNTYKQYDQIVNQHIHPYLGNLKLKDIRPDHIQSLYNKKIELGTGLRTVRLIHAVLRHALNQALKTGLLVRNPADAVIVPRLVRKEMKTLNDTQVRNMLLVSKGTRLETLLYVAATTGLRMGELLGLKWDDLDITSRTIQIRRQIQRQKDKGLVECEPKSKSSRRIVILGSSTIEKLKTHFIEQQSHRHLVGDRWIENGLIFPNTFGKPLEQSRVHKEFKVILLEAGLPIIRFHDLRHSAATLMFQMGINPKVVKEMLGHSDINLTLNTYTHSLQSLQIDASDKMDEIVTMIEVEPSNKSI